MEKRNLDQENYRKIEDGFSDEHRIFRLSPPPKALPFSVYIQRYLQTGDQAYFLAFLHHYESIINSRTREYAYNYAMQEHWLDIKQTIVEALMIAVQNYDPESGKDYLAVANSYVKDAVHTYIRTMRTGFTLGNAHEDELVRAAMREFHKHGGRTDNRVISAIAERINRSPQFTRELIQDAFRNENLAPAVRANEDEDEEELGQYAPDSTPDPEQLFFLLGQRKLLYDAFNSLTLREQEIVSEHLGFCPDCWSNRIRADGKILKRDFHYIGLTHEIQEKAAERAYHGALRKMKEYVEQRESKMTL